MADEPTPQEIPAEGRPEWLPEQFQTPEALAQSYQESRKEMDRMRDEMQKEREAFTAALENFQQPPAPPIPGQQQIYDPAMSAYAAAYENGDIQGMLAAQAQYTLNPTIEAVGRLIDEKLSAITPAVQQAQAAQREHDLRLAEGLVERQLGPDRYSELLPRIRELAADNPNYLPTSTSVEGYAASIMNIAKLAEHDTMERRLVEFEQERQEKLGAQTLTSGYNRQTADPDEARADFERVKNTPTGSFEEMMQRARGA